MHFNIQIVLSITMFLRGLKKKKVVANQTWEVLPPFAAVNSAWPPDVVEHLTMLYTDNQVYTIEQRIALWERLYPGSYLHVSQTDMERYNHMRLATFEYEYLGNHGLIDLVLC